MASNFKIPNLPNASYARQADWTYTDVDTIANSLAERIVIINDSGGVNFNVTVFSGMTLDIPAFKFVLASDSLRTCIGGTKVVTDGDATNPRIDILWVNSSGTLTVTAGTPAANPLPSTSIRNDSSHLILALIYVPAGANAGAPLTNNNIIQKAITRRSPEYQLWIPGTDFTGQSVGTPAMSALQGTAPNAYKAMAFDGTADEEAQMEQFIIFPRDMWVSGITTLDIYWVNLGAGAGNVKWTVTPWIFDEAESLVGASTSSTLTLTGATANTQNLLKVTTSTGFNFGTNSGTFNLMKFSVKRLATDAGDTLTNDAGLIGLNLVVRDLVL